MSMGRCSRSPPWEKCFIWRTMREVIKEFCEEYLGDDFDYVFSIHNDQKHMHGHIVFNSVNRMSGYKYRYENGDCSHFLPPASLRHLSGHWKSLLHLSLPLHVHIPL